MWKELIIATLNNTDHQPTNYKVELKKPDTNSTHHIFNLNTDEKQPKKPVVAEARQMVPPEYWLWQWREVLGCL